MEEKLVWQVLEMEWAGRDPVEAVPMAIMPGYGVMGKDSVSSREGWEVSLLREDGGDREDCGLGISGRISRRAEGTRNWGRANTTYRGYLGNVMREADCASAR